jgi:hypothetical protein
METVTGNGVYVPQICPEPDSPLTVEWGKAIAWGVKRLLNGGTMYGTFKFSPNPNSFSFYGVSIYSKTPFVKMYEYTGSGVNRRFTDGYTLGTGADDLMKSRISFEDKTSPSVADVATVTFGGFGEFGLAFDGYIVLAQGR